MDKVLENGYNNWQFIHIYGSPLNTIGKYKKKMNRDKNLKINSVKMNKLFFKVKELVMLLIINLKLYKMLKRMNIKI